MKTTVEWKFVFHLSSRYTAAARRVRNPMFKLVRNQTNRNYNNLLSSLHPSSIFSSLCYMPYPFSSLALPFESRFIQRSFFSLPLSLHFPPLSLLAVLLPTHHPALPSLSPPPSSPSSSLPFPPTNPLNPSIPPSLPSTISITLSLPPSLCLLFQKSIQWNSY